jgi:ankyrin repeat protein
MSEVSVQVILYNNNVEYIDNLESYLRELTGEQVEIASVDKVGAVLIASLNTPGSFDFDEFKSVLLKTDPTWFYYHADFLQSDEIENIYLKQGGGKTTKKTFFKNLRELSKEFDLYYSLLHGEIDKAHALISDNAIDINANIAGVPLLFYILMTSNLKLLKLAVKKGENIHQIAPQNKHIEIENASPFVYLDISKGMTLLHIAIKLKARNLIDFLVKQGVDINKVDCAGNKAINLAASCDTLISAVERLTALGADINYETEYGNTPLFDLLEGSEYSDKKIISIAKKWIELGADIHFISKRRGHNALWVVGGRSDALIDFVRSFGINKLYADKKYYEGLTNFSKHSNAIIKSDIDTINETFNIKDFDKKEQASLAASAACYSSLETLKVLVKKGLPIHLYESDCLPHEYAKLAKKEENYSYLKNAYDEYRSAFESDIQKAVPLFDTLIETAKSVPDNAYGWESKIQYYESFFRHPFYKNCPEAEFTKLQFALNSFTSIIKECRNKKEIDKLTKLRLDEKNIIHFILLSNIGGFNDVLISISTLRDPEVVSIERSI